MQFLRKKCFFYSNLYTSCNGIECDEDICEKLNISDNDIPKVSFDEANSCEGVITLGECATAAVKSMANIKSP